MNINEKEPKMEIPKSFIRINQKEHNLASLLALLKDNGIKVNLVSARNPDTDALRKVAKDYIPVTWSQIEVEAPYNEIKQVLESSDEFKEHADKLLGSI